MSRFGVRTTSLPSFFSDVNGKELNLHVNHPTKSPVIQKLANEYGRCIGRVSAEMDRVRLADRAALIKRTHRHIESLLKTMKRVAQIMDDALSSLHH